MINLDALVSSPSELAKGVATREKALRKKKGLTQAALAERAAVSLGSLRRFEQTGHIAFDALVRICVALQCTDDIDNLFARKAYASIDEVLNEWR